MVEPQANCNQQHTNLVIPGNPLAVRNGLRALFDSLLLQGLQEEERGTAEIVLAEALNNIVEHAYAGRDGEIELSLQVSHNSLVCTISDNGQPMPNNVLPAGKLESYSDMDSLPEGGFGWHLIRSLSQELDYRHENGRNHLSFRLESKQSEAPS